MSIQGVTRRYERWLRKQCDVVDADLYHKHERMRKNAFVFLRATYYRLAEQIEEWCPELRDAPEVLAIGDIHTENFGTWRDSDGRLVWGVNDFDEASTMPYVLDLVRLATSAVLAPGHLFASAATSAAILEGYEEGLASPRPTVLDEEELWMRRFVESTSRHHKKFWREVSEYKNRTPPRKVSMRLKESLPPDARILRFCKRVKGGGSLGRPRYVAVAEWRGGKVLREAKALVPSAWDWAHKRSTDHSILRKLAGGRFRSPDPFLHTKGHFIYRRIAPDSRKVELGENAGSHLSRHLLRAMGFDLGAIHAAHQEHIKEIRNDLKRRPDGWLTAASDKAAAAVRRDYLSWRSRLRPAV